MKQVRIAELKDRLSEHLRAVEQGIEVEVLDRKRPIARIVPVPPSRPSVHILPPARPFDEIRDRRRARAGWPISSTELLSDERRER